MWLQVCTCHKIISAPAVCMYRVYHEHFKPQLDACKPWKHFMPNFSTVPSAQSELCMSHPKTSMTAGTCGCFPDRQNGAEQQVETEHLRYSQRPLQARPAQTDSQPRKPHAGA